MSILTVLLFFIYTWGIGYSASRFVKFEADAFEKLMMRIGLGLGIMPILLVLLNFLRIPLDWKIILVVSLLIPVYDLVNTLRQKRKISLPRLVLKKSYMAYFLLFLIFSFSLLMYVSGSFKYNYLEDTDPWGHAVVVKYISVEKTAFDLPRENLLVKQEDPLNYIDPYPPGYGAMMGILHQTNDSVSWTLKFFNSLIIVLGIIMFFFFAQLFMGDRWKALLATFILAAIPSYFTHFIWAHTLVIALIFPALYCFERIDNDKRWAVLGALIVASIFVTQPSQPIKIMGLFLIYGAVKCIVLRKWSYPLWGSMIGGVLLSFIWWGHMLVKYNGPKGIAILLGYIGKNAETTSSAVAEAAGTSIGSLFFKIFNPTSGSASRAYTFSDFFIAKHYGMINVTVGWGIFVSLLLVLGILFFILYYKKNKETRNYWLPITIGWFIFTFLGTNSLTFNLPVGFIAFRFWLLLAIPVALLAAYGATQSISIGKKIGIPGSIILVVLLVGVFFTAATPKYSVNTSLWPTRGYFGGGVPAVATAYGDWFASLPEDAVVFMPSDKSRIPLGFDRQSCAWCTEVVEMTTNTCFLELEASEIYSFLKRNNYDYLLLGAGDIKLFEALCSSETVSDDFSAKLAELVESGHFVPVTTVENIFVAFKVN